MRGTVKIAYFGWRAVFAIVAAGVGACEMTYSGSQALLAIPADRLWCPFSAPAVQGRSHAR